MATKQIANAQAPADLARGAAAQAQLALQQTTNRLTALERQRESQLPDLKVRLVDIYKRGRGGYARMLLGQAQQYDVRRLRPEAHTSLPDDLDTKNTMRMKGSSAAPASLAE